MSIQKLVALRDFWLELAENAPSPELQAEFLLHAKHGEEIIATITRTSELIAESRGLLEQADEDMPDVQVGRISDA